MRSIDLPSRPARKPRKVALGIVCAHAAGSALAAATLGFLVGGSELEQWQLAVRYTARVACLWFLAAYVARPLHALAGAAWTLRWQGLRRTFGLAFASAMSVHLTAVVVYLALGGGWPRPMSLAYLVFATLLLAAMVITSNLQLQKRWSSGWRRLHRFGMHVQWGAFAGAFGFAVQRREVYAWPFLILALVGAAIRGMVVVR
jgi:methionine sulfoxide reductase heme-binding subunit